jgi:signal transduction histidine kinase
MDASRILQVLANLIGNAVKFTPADGEIRVCVEHRSGELVISVADTGAGIPADEAPHVFERFWHRRRGAHKRGSGLGLAISKGIVEAHGGRIWVDSQLGAGSTFCFTLPLDHI